MAAAGANEMRDDGQTASALFQPTVRPELENTLRSNTKVDCALTSLCRDLPDLGGAENELRLPLQFPMRGIRPTARHIL